MQSSTAYLKCQTKFLWWVFMNCLIFNGSLAVSCCIIKTLAFWSESGEDLMNEQSSPFSPRFCDRGGAGDEAMHETMTAILWNTSSVTKWNFPHFSLAARHNAHGFSLTITSFSTPCDHFGEEEKNSDKKKTLKCLIVCSISCSIIGKVKKETSARCEKLSTELLST